MGATATYSWPWPELTPDLADGPAAFAALGAAIEQTMTDGAVTTYVPSWTGAGANPAAPSSIAGWYRLDGRWCDMGVYMLFGAGTTGGWGALTVGLPLPAAADVPYQTVATRLWVPAGLGLCEGLALIAASASVCTPQFIVTANTAGPAGNWQNASSAALTVGTGVPVATGALTIQSTGFTYINGRYLTT